MGKYNTELFIRFDIRFHPFCFGDFVKVSHNFENRMVVLFLQMAERFTQIYTCCVAVGSIHLHTHNHHS